MNREYNRIKEKKRHGFLFIYTKSRYYTPRVKFHFTKMLLIIAIYPWDPAALLKHIM